MQQQQSPLLSADKDAEGQMLCLPELSQSIGTYEVTLPFLHLLKTKWQVLILLSVLFHKNVTQVGCVPFPPLYKSI